MNEGPGSVKGTRALGVGAATVSGARLRGICGSAAGHSVRLRRGYDTVRFRRGPATDDPRFPADFSW